MGIGGDWWRDPAVNGLDDASGYGASAEARIVRLCAGQRIGRVRHRSDQPVRLRGVPASNRDQHVDGPGDRDGYGNLSGRLRATWHPRSGVEIGAAALALTGTSEFDGFDFFTGAHADTLDESSNRLSAGRVWATAGSDELAWRAKVAGSLLGSSNENFLADVAQNRTRGTRRNVSAQLERRLSTGSIDHRLIVAADTERETFHARDTAFGGFTNQDRTRRHQLLTAEWRAEAKAVTGDVAVRHDLFNRIKDATSVRASLLAQAGGGFSIAGSYAEGIAQPTFFDLFGFFPGNFVGNPSLNPESSRGFEASLRYRRGKIGASLTAYRQRLHDEIVNNATFTSVLNAPGK